MAKNVNVYTLGQFGVNRVKSPVHVQNGELLSSQNATVKLVQGQLALSKRDGMVKINSSVAAGTLLAIKNIPLDPSMCILISPDNEWEAGAWSPSLSLFAVVSTSGTGNRVITSPNGIDWTSRASAADVPWKDVTWSVDLSLFVAVGGSTLTATEQVMTSPDGITWTSRTASSDRTWSGVVWAPSLSLFAAVAQDGAAAGVVMTSPDGITWTARTAPASKSWRKVTWATALGLFIAVGSIVGATDEVMTSPDGINWTLRDPAVNSNGGWYDVAWSPTLSRAVIVGLPSGGAAAILYSDNGTTWTATSYTSDWLSGVAWSPELGIFVASANSGNIVATSADGITWQRDSTHCSQSSLADVVYSPALEQFLLIGDDSAGAALMELLG